ncbi:MAG: metal-dependent hydrolase [Acidobacteriaceae bacterium]|jgi:L-ascorbate metabolism protein UlaG (beta-lactamase superfamily)|nr:metal-dependent hydrolase [Acidobacteriaceae bacterium]
MPQITWLGHSTFSLTLASGEVIVVDPFIAGNPSFPSGYEFPRVDTILVTHGHGDHLSGVQGLAGQFAPRVVANYEICNWLDAQGVKNTVPMNFGGTMAIGGVAVTMTPALHSSAIEQPDGRNIYGGNPGGYIVRLEDGRAVYFAGDTDVFGDMALIRELHAPELVVLPIGDVYTMSPRGAAVAARLLQPKIIIPAHYGTFPPLTGTPAELQALVDVPVWRLTPGLPVTW